MISRTFIFSLFSVAVTFQAWGQQPQSPGGGGQTPQTPGAPAQAAPPDANQVQPPRELPSDSIRPNYVLGPNDQILIRAPGAEEINERPFRIDSEGYINLPLIGRIRAGGLNQQQ